MTRLVALLAVAVGSALAAPAQTPAAVAVADLADLLAPIRSKHEMPALGAAVLVDGRLAALGVSGVRRVGRDEVVTNDDLWHLGSCTKAMTATLLATFVEAGKLSWTATVAETLPDLGATMHAASRAITVQQLLAHRSGLAGGPPDALWKRLWTWQGSLPDARTEVARTMLGEALQPGAPFRYSNAGYIVAGAIVERLGASPWEELLRERVWAPLGITTGGFGPPGTKDAPTAPWGHVRGKEGRDEPRFADNPPALGPAGTAHMTLRDWAKFAALHLGEAPQGGTPLLAPATLAALHAPVGGGDYALGWSVTKRPWSAGPILTHSGSNTMWFCVAWLAPAAKFAVLVTCNHANGGKACDAVAAACVQRFAPKK